MLDLMTPEQFRERFAFWLLQDMTDPRRRHAELIAEVHNTITRYIAAKSGRQPSQSHLLTADKMITPLFGGGTGRTMTAVDDVDAESVAKALGCI